MRDIFIKNGRLEIEKSDGAVINGNFEVRSVSKGLTCQLKWVEDGRIIKLGNSGEKYLYELKKDETGQILVKTKEKYIIFKGYI